MFNLSDNNIITINRGDSGAFYFFVNVCDNLFVRQYNLKEGDEVYFGVMEPHQPFEVALIRKKYTYEDVTEQGCIFIELESKDTVCLMPGTYYYEIKLKTENGVRTLIDRKKFIILE